MTASLAPRPEDVYDAATIASFRSAGYWRDDSLAACVDRLAAQSPDRILVTDGYAVLTTTELREQAYRLAGALRGLGVRAGDRVQVQLPNWHEFIVAYVALARIGAVLVPTTRCAMSCSTARPRWRSSPGSSAASTTRTCWPTSGPRCLTWSR